VSSHKRVRCLEAMTHMGWRKLIGLDGAEKAPHVGEFREAVFGVDQVDMRPLPLDTGCVDCFPSLRRCIDC
jgi:hypothetical protein